MKYYFAHNPRTDEIFASPCFKRVYNAALLELRYSDSGTFRIYAVSVFNDEWTFGEVAAQFTRSNLRCKLHVQILSERIGIRSYPNGKYGNCVTLPKREPSDD